MHCSLLRGMVGRLMSDRERERLLHKLPYLVSADLRGIELHARKSGLDGGGEQIIGRLGDLDARGLIYATRGIHGELRVDLSLDAGAAKRLRVRRRNGSGSHGGRLLNLEREVRLGVRDRSLSADDAVCNTTFNALATEVSDVGDLLGQVDVRDL